MTSSSRSVSKKILKFLLWTVDAVAALIVLVLSAACLIVRLDKTSQKVSELATGYVDADVQVGGMRLRLLRDFPDITFSVLEGRVVTERKDTLLSFDDLSVRASWIPLLKRSIVVPEIALDGLEVDARGYRDGSVNWDIFPADTTAKEKDTTALALPEMHLGELVIRAPKLSFTSPNYHLKASLTTRLGADNTPDGGLSASLKEFDFDSYPVKMDLTADADSLLSDDPHFKVDGRIRAGLDRMAEFIPEQFKLDGNLEIDLAAEALLSQLCLERFPAAALEASITADQLNLLAPEEDLAASVQEPSIKLHSPAGKPLLADITMDKVLFKSGATKVLVKDMDFKAMAGGDPEKMRRRKAERRAEKGLPPMPQRRTDGRPREIPDFLSEPDFRLSDINLKMDKVVSDLILKLHPVGGLDVAQGIVITPALPLRNKIDSLSLRFDTDEFTIKRMDIKSGTSDISAQGSISGLGMMLSGHGLLKMDMGLKSGRLNVNELLAALDEGNSSISATADTLDVEALELEISEVTLSDTDFSQADTVTSASGLLVVPANLIANIDIDASRVDYSSVEVKDFHTNIKMQERCLQVNELKAYSDICNVALDAFYSTRTKEDITAGFDLGLYDITADKVIELIPAVDEVLPMLTSFKGDLNCELAATSQLDTNMNFLLPSLEGIFKISGQDLLLEDLGDMKKVARLLLFKDKEHGRIHDMSVNGTISNSQIQVYPFLLGIDRYAFGLKGTQGFNGKFRYHVSLIDTPLPLKIGVNLYGSDFDHLHWNLGRARYKTKKLPELYEEVDDMQLNLATSIRNIFQRGVDTAVKEHRKRLEKLDKTEEEMDSGLEMEPLSEEEEALFEELTLFSEIDDLTGDIIAEIIAGNK